MKDTHGREYARLSDLKPGDKVQVDSGFTCTPDNVTRKVYAAKNGDLCIRCGGPFEVGETKDAPQVHDHALDGQLAYKDYLVGVYKL